MDYNYFHNHVHSLHRNSITVDIVISCLVSQLHRFIWVHDLIVLILLLHEYLSNTDI